MNRTDITVTTESVCSSREAVFKVQLAEILHAQHAQRPKRIYSNLIK